MKSLLFVLVFLFTTSLYSSEALETSSYQEVFQKLDEKVAQYGRDKVLLVLDIDNTVLTMATDLGSDQWFSWQEEIIKQEGCEPLCVTKDINKLIEYQGILFNLGKMLPTESSLATKVREYQKRNQKIILLTSRGSDFRSLTEKSLVENNFSFKESAIGFQGGVVGTYLPYDIKNPQRYALTPEDIAAANLKEARPVSYQNGIYMTSGQNKGIMLKVLLKKFSSQYKAIVFVDDHKRHVDRMQAILGNVLDVTTFRYGRIDPAVERFKKSDKREVTEKWYRLKNILTEIGFAI